MRKELEQRIYPHALRFALVLVPQGDLAIRITRRAIRDVLGESHRLPTSPHTAVLEAVQRLAASRSRSGDPALSSDERLARTVSELCDGQGMSLRTTARYLGIPVEEVERLHEFAHLAAGASPPVHSRCSGWSLVRRHDELAPFEVEVAERHLALCRECFDAHRSRRGAQDRLLKAIPIAGSGIVAVGGLAGAATLIAGAVAGVVAVGVLAVASSVEVIESNEMPLAGPAFTIQVDDPLGPSWSPTPPTLAAEIHVAPEPAPGRPSSGLPPAPTSSGPPPVPANVDAGRADPPDVLEPPPLPAAPSRPLEPVAQVEQAAPVLAPAEAVLEPVVDPPRPIPDVVGPAVDALDPVASVVDPIVDPLVAPLVPAICEPGLITLSC